jgi:hypothetical protein
MVRITVLYLNESGKRFDHGYYASKHLPSTGPDCRQQRAGRCGTQRGDPQHPNCLLSNYRSVDMGLVASLAQPGGNIAGPSGHM